MAVAAGPLVVERNTDATKAAFWLLNKVQRFRNDNVQRVPFDFLERNWHEADVPAFAKVEIYSEMSLTAEKTQTFERATAWSNDLLNMLLHAL
jgi:hypothetical protein